MKKVELYEPALCCDTGVCGPGVDDNLLLMTALFNTMQASPQIFAAERFNLNSTPDAFIKNEIVLNYLKEAGNAILPITIIDGVVKKTGAYPTLAEISEYTGTVFVREQAPHKTCSGNDSTTDCC